jgi:phosphoribosylaminoimidazole (AIR) synthetase
LKAFNYGIGMVLIMDRSDNWHFLKWHRSAEIGIVLKRKICEKQVIVQNFQTALGLAK